MVLTLRNKVVSLILENTIPCCINLYLFHCMVSPVVLDVRPKLVEQSSRRDLLTSCKDLHNKR